jgi:phospholipase C
MTSTSASGFVRPDPIDHVVVLALENRSFDRMLGALKAVYPELQGVDPANAAGNAGPHGKLFQQPNASNTVKPDPQHDTVNVVRQLEKDNGQFVLDFALSFPSATPDQLQEIMNYHALDSLPALHALARDFTICDHWFSSVPGPTWANRFFLHSGTSLGRVVMPQGVFNLNLHNYDQFTIFDRLSDRGIPWKVYFHDFPQSWVLVHQLEPANAVRNFNINQFFTDAAGDPAAFPAYSFIEPKYFWPRQNDDHPPHDTMLAQTLIAQVYNALRANAGLWRSTLLIVLYDEHGGFFDHVPPPAAVPPDGHTEEYTFDRLGVRVPALLVSPWVERGVFSGVLDHTSLLKYLTDKWNLGPLTARVAAAGTFAGALRTEGGPREDTAESIEMPVGLSFAAGPEAEAESSDAMNANQQAIVAFSRVLEGKIADDPESKVRRFMTAMEGTQAQFRVARERANLFLQQTARAFPFGRS